MDLAVFISRSAGSPTLAQISQIAEADFDLIQIHGDTVDLVIKTAKSI